MLLGSDGPGGIEFDDAELAREVGIVGLALILYEGGLQTSWRRLRQVAVPAALLSTVGVVVSAVLTGVAAHVLFDVSWLESILLGAVVSSTDAAAVFATLRATHIRRRVARTLEAESGGNDPMAIALTLGLIAWIEKPDSYGFENLALLVVQQLGLGLLVGIVLGVGVSWLFARLPHSIGVFAPVASVAAAALSFGAADTMGGSGFLAVYLVGLAVGSTPSRYRRELVAFHEGLAFLAQVALFIVLGLLVFPSQLSDVALGGLALAVLLMLVIRPVAVWASTAFSDFTSRERLLLGWAGLRGAVPIVLATFVLSSDVPHSNTIFNAVFFVVVISTIVQGTSLEWFAGRLGPALAGSGGARGTARGEPAQQARPDRLRGRPGPRDRRRRGSGARSATQRDRGRRRPRRGLDPAEGQHASSGRATACSCSRLARCARTSTTSSRAGVAASRWSAGSASRGARQTEAGRPAASLRFALPIPARGRNRRGRGPRLRPQERSLRGRRPPRFPA